MLQQHLLDSWRRRTSKLVSEPNEVLKVWTKRLEDVDKTIDEFWRNNEREDSGDNASNSFWSEEIAGGRFWKKKSKLFFIGNCGERVLK